MLNITPSAPALLHKPVGVIGEHMCYLYLIDRLQHVTIVTSAFLMHEHTIVLGLDSDSSTHVEDVEHSSQLSLVVLECHLYWEEDW